MIHRACILALVLIFGGNVQGAILLPSAGKSLMIIGQDLESEWLYVTSGLFPDPAGVTTYLSFYDLLNPSFPQFGALGEDAEGNVLSYDVNWGAGPLHCHNAAHGYPYSTLQVGLNIAEGNNGTIWHPDGLTQIADGNRDAEIVRLATFFNALENIPVYLRIGYEFDGRWNDGFENHSLYIAAYRRIVDVLDTHGVDNVAYVWHSCTSPIDDLIEGYREDPMDWYPGDDYVDWIGISWFLLPDELPPLGGNPATQRELADEMLTIARSLGKPAMIAESTPQGYHISQGMNANISILWDGPAGENVVSKTSEEIWNEWYATFFDYIHANSDVIRAVSYINCHWDSQPMWGPPYSSGFWGDTRVQADAAITEFWLSELSDDLWLHGSPELFDLLLNTSTDVDTESGPLRLHVSQPLPNPSPGISTVHFSIRSSEYVEAVVFDVRGRRVKTLISEQLVPGNHSARWDGKGAEGKRMPAGSYLLLLRTDAGLTSRKLILLD